MHYRKQLLLLVLGAVMCNTQFALFMVTEHYRLLDEHEGMSVCSRNVGAPLDVGDRIGAGEWLVCRSEKDAVLIRCEVSQRVEGKHMFIQISTGLGGRPMTRIDMDKLYRLRRIGSVKIRRSRNAAH